MSDETEKHCMCGCIYLESDCPNCNKVTDATRIEELEDHVANMAGLWAKSDGEKQLLLGRIKELEANLAKAVKLMELSVELATWNTTLLEDVIDFITELKGQDDG
jgi:protein gp37